MPRAASADRAPPAPLVGALARTMPLGVQQEGIVLAIGVWP